jgi:hypothetical protein
LQSVPRDMCEGRRRLKKKRLLHCIFCPFVALWVGV